MAKREKVKMVDVASSSTALKKVSKAGPIDLPQLQRRIFPVYLMGETPIIVHAWSQKALEEMVAKQMGQKMPQTNRSPVEDFKSSLYHLNDGAYGFPATGIKRALVSACSSMNKEISQTLVRQAFFISGEEGTSKSGLSGLESPMQLLRVHSPNPPRMREDAVRVGPFGNRKATVTYRAEFSPWAMRFNLVYNALVVTPSTVAAIVDTAGFAVGLGEWRQEKGGIYGQYRLADKKETAEIDKWAKMKPKAPVLPDEEKFLHDLYERVKKYGVKQDENEELEIPENAKFKRSKNGGAALQ